MKTPEVGVGKIGSCVVLVAAMAFMTVAFNNCGGFTAEHTMGASGGSGTGNSDAPPDTSGSPVSYPDKPFADNQMPELVAADVGSTEGPVWSPQLNGLLFSDQGNKRLYSVIGMSVTIYPNPTVVQTNGLAVDRNGDLIAMDVTNARVVRYPWDPVNKRLKMETPVVLVDKWMGSNFNGPNDVIVGKDGSLYFTDPRWGTTVYGYAGIFRIKPNGELKLMSSKVPRPNGITISPDFKKIYVDDEPSSSVYVFDLDDNGDFKDENGHVFWSIPAGTGGAEADGMTADLAGNVYITSHMKLFIVAPDKTNPVVGNLIQTFNFYDATTNVGFGGSDFKTLYVTDGPKVWSLRSAIPGVEANLFK